MKLQFCLLVFTFLFFVSPLTAQKKSQISDVPTVDFCDLVNQPSKYDKKIVRTKAIFVSGYHGTSLYDYRCNSGEASMSASGEKSDIFRTKKNINKKYEEILNAKSDESSNRAYVTVIGRFNDWRGYGYGSYGWYRFEFVRLSFESIEPVNSTVPWMEKESEFMKEVENLRGLDTSLIFDYSDDKMYLLNGIFSDNYVFLDLEGKTYDKAKFFEEFSVAKTTRQKAVKYGRIFIDGNKAIAKDVEAIVYMCPKTFLLQYRYDNSYEKQDGNWKLVKTQLTSNKASFKLPCY